MFLEGTMDSIIIIIIIKISENPFIINAGMPSSPADFEERGHLIALNTSESETDKTL
jgi:hypothetical protein